MSNENYEFHLGLTMAGAVSAGCYTSGVIDYLFETLDLWERAKAGEVEGLDMSLVPQNKVTIDAMGGCSAGGMTTIIAALYALKGDIKPVKEIPENPLDDQNVLYDSWVHLDDNNENTFKQIWDTDDLTDDILSLFNSKVIDAIASNLLDGNESDENFSELVEKNLPKFFSKDLELILSHTMLRGIPLKVDFKSEIARRFKNSPKHNTFEHYLVSHFKLNSGNPVNENSYLWFNPYVKKYTRQIKFSTIATGAFPVGLRYREFDNGQFSDDYIKSVTKRVIYGDFSKEDPDKEKGTLELDVIQNFESLTVDGGAINNEPYREVGSILKGKFHKDENEYQNYGLVMIDPFPDNDDVERPYKKPKGLLTVVPKIIQTLWNQAKVKRKEMLEQYNADFFKTVIYPIKYIVKDGRVEDRDRFPLASASFNAFGGFLDVQFRVHDFFLGRNNARNFVRYYASFPYDPDNNNVHPLHANWTEAMVKKFEIRKKGDDRIYLPIIPDLNMVLDGTNPKEERLDYTYGKKPKYNPQKLIKLEKNIKNRFRRILDLALDGMNNPKEVQESFPISNQWIKSFNRKNIFQKIGSSFGGWFVGGLKKPVKKNVSKMLSKWIITYILKDLETMDILEKKE